MNKITDYREFLKELDIRLETLGVVHRHLLRIEQSCDEGCRLRTASKDEEHISFMLCEQEEETFARLLSEVENLYAFMQQGKGLFVSDRTK